MKSNRKYKMENNEEAVSAVIGVILMVAITVAIAATVYVYVSGMMGGGQESTPTIAFNADNSNDRFTIVSAGVETAWTDVQIKSDVACSLAANGGAAQPFLAGEYQPATNITGLSGNIVAGTYIDITVATGPVIVTFLYEPTNSVMGSVTVQV